MGSRKPATPQGLCAYFVEIKECDGVTSVPDEVTFLVKKCILDKIFSENPDYVAICRSDATSQIGFVPANWDGLKKGLAVLTEGRSCEGGIENPIAGLNDVVNAVIAQAEEDTYDEKKVIYFANLSSYVLDEKDVVKLAMKLRANDVHLSVIVPRKADMSDIQIQNSKLIKRVLYQKEYESLSDVTNMEQACREILNTQSKRAKRPTPWNVQLEVTPEIIINVGGYASTRKNTSSDLAMTRVLVTETDTEASTTNSAANSADNQSQATSSSEKTVVVEPAKSAVVKEKTWKDNEDNVIGQDDIGKAYYFGDKLIPYNELESEDSYKSGGKCLKLLAFCPKEKISPQFLAGDGVTLFFPKIGHVESEVKLKALIKAMINTERVAIVRRVYRKDSRATIGTLVPDEERQCLVYSELCFADDISVPQFPYLIKPEALADEDVDNVELSEKEALIDELIKAKTLDSFHPSDGPSDPAHKVLREKVTAKIIKDSEQDTECRNTDTIEIRFKGLFVENEELLEKILASFPLKENHVENERLAGTKIFRKRSVDEVLQNDSAKKPKIENESTCKDEKVEMEEDPNKFDDLFDEL